ncbi:twin-arginine translocase TatA/TatE family subunit [Candidatus Poribacteria bacterium]|nr:MAG: twin-arginine translocase TatA/TatE family subunit [Candidatus Poribacteria bacterium]
MFTGGWEWIIILALVVLLFGAKKLPELARGIGKSITTFKSGLNEGQSEDDDTTVQDKDTPQEKEVG